MRHTLLALLALTAATPAFAAPFTVEEGGRGFARLQAAVDAIGGGDGTIRIAAGTYRDCAVVKAGRVAFAAAAPGTAIFDGGACEGKATLVLRGRDSAVDGLVFRNIRVPDRNGAGIRLEAGSLTVTRSRFQDSEQGILTVADPAQRVTIDRSTFSGLGSCENVAGCAHSIYIGQGASLTVRNSRFERGTGGHYVKSRARQIAVLDSSFDDSRGTATNYMIDLSLGATGRISGNEFVGGSSKENRTGFITVAPEGQDNRSAGLTVVGNRASLVPGASYSTIFVVDWSHEPLKIGPNQIAARIKPFEVRTR